LVVLFGNQDNEKIVPPFHDSSVNMKFIYEPWFKKK
jgi:hypothetical protein